MSKNPDSDTMVVIDFSELLESNGLSEDTLQIFRALCSICNGRDTESVVYAAFHLYELSLLKACPDYACHVQNSERSHFILDSNARRFYGVNN